MKRIYKTVEQENGTIKIYGSNRWIEVDYNHKPDWAEDDVEASFRYRGHRYYLSEFMRMGYGGGWVPDWLKEFDGQAGDSFFSGILVKLSNDGEAVKAFTYIS